MAVRALWAGGDRGGAWQFSFHGSLGPSRDAGTLVVQSLRGPESGAHVAASRPFLLVFDIAAASPLPRNRSVNAEGTTFEKHRPAQDGWLTASVRNFLAEVLEVACLRQAGRSRPDRGIQTTSR